MQIHSYCTDMLILPENNQERQAIIKWAKQKGYYGTVSFKSHISNVKGQSWYGKRFYEIPFAIYQKDDLISFIANERGNNESNSTMA